MEIEKNFDLIILAGGFSERMGNDKLLMAIGNTSILRRTVSAFYNHKRIANIILVLRPDLTDVGISIHHEFGDKIKLTKGGLTRTESVENGLVFVESEKVLIHDGARPFVSTNLIDKVMNSVDNYGSGVPSLPVTDSIRTIENGYISAFCDRNSFVMVQTPQGFLTKQIKLAYEKRQGQSFTDDSEIYSKFIGKVKVTSGEAKNIKITTMSDYFGLNSKIGIGYDIHNLIEGRKLILCGIHIPYEKGLAAHSDGDVVIHALIDSMLSAIGERDIGTFFPDTDPLYKNIDSFKLLNVIKDLYKQNNYKINNISIVIIADEPKLNKYIPAMITKLAGFLDLPCENIGISAKTTEKNRLTSIECQAVCIVN